MGSGVGLESGVGAETVTESGLGTGTLMVMGTGTKLERKLEWRRTKECMTGAGTGAETGR